MLYNYIKIALRAFSRNLSHSIINVLGLTLGITCSIAIFLLVGDELSYDTYHEKGSRIYRLITTKTDGSGSTTGVPLPLPQAFNTDFPNLERQILLDHFRSGKITIPQEDSQSGQPNVFIEDEGLVYIQNGFFQLFDWQWLSGDAIHALDKPNSVVLSQSYAKKYFGEGEYLGKNLSLDDTTNLIVTGVVADRPFNTDFPFNVIISFSTVEKVKDMTNWGSVSSDHQFFILLSENQPLLTIDSRLPAFSVKYLDDDAKKIKYYLQPLEEMHFSADVSNMNYRTISKPMLLAISLVAIFLLVIGSINFINLETARAIKRAKEVGIRKTLGSNRTELILQFLGETAMIVIIAMIISLGLTELLLIELREFTDLPMEFQPFTNLVMIGSMILLIIAITLGAGFYPAIVLSSYKASEVLKGSVSGGSSSKFGLRQLLVSLQFAVSQIFIVCTLITIQQIDYIRTTDMGFNKEQIVDLSLHEGSFLKQDLIRGEIDKLTGVASYTYCNYPPFSGSVWSTNIDLLSTPEVEDIDTNYKLGDAKYIDTYGIRLVAGTGIVSSDTANRVVINESLLKALGFSDPEEAIGEFIKVNRWELPIVGVVEDFHTYGFDQKIPPLILMSYPKWNRTAGVKIEAGKTTEVLAGLESIWKEVFPDYEFEPEFLDEAIMSHYESEQKMSTLLVGFSIIAIIICGLGLYGLVSFMANQKTKEVGIRKTLGASTIIIVRLFSAEFLKLLIIGFIISAPLAWYIMDGWLQQFEYKISIGFTVFVVGLLLSAFIALTTVGYRSYRAAMANPVASLKED
jgi:putative ABC transport system permease protein